MMKTVLISFAIIANLGFPTVWSSSHRFEDDFVEKTLAIIVRGNKAEITYSIGLNKKTAEKVLSEWSKLDANAVSSETTATPLKTEASEIEIEPNSDSGHALSPELTKKLHEAAGKFITKKLNVKIGNEQLPLKLISTGPAPRHPFAVTIKWELAIPEQKVVDFEIVDNNFLGLKGASRTAIKATGDAMLLQSNTSPILIRAQRKLLDDLTPGERKDEMSIRAKIGFAKR
ncbi:MAG: hypothetical protein ACPHO8_15185 [Mariniblastus sp.]